MNVELIESNDITKEFIFDMLKKNEMNVSYDSDGDIKVKELHNIYFKVFKDMEVIDIFCIYQENDKLSREELIYQANSISVAYKFNVSILKNNGVIFSLLVPFDGGIVEQCFISVIKKFAEMVSFIIYDKEYTLTDLE